MIKQRGDTLTSSGKFFVLYSEEGKGKSTSTIQSLPERIAYVSCEPRNPYEWLAASGRNPEDIDFIFPDSYEDLINFYQDTDRIVQEYKATVLDGVSYLMEIELSMEILDQHFESKYIDEITGKVKKGISKVHMLQSKMSEEGYGILAKQMGRLFRHIARLSQRGLIVVVLCLLDNNPTYQRALKEGPLLPGRAFAKVLPGFVDYIGRVKDYVNKDGFKDFPPSVDFEGSGFMCKYTGSNLKGDAFDLSLDFKWLIKNL